MLAWSWFLSKAAGCCELCNAWHSVDLYLLMLAGRGWGIWCQRHLSEALTRAKKHPSKINISNLVSKPMIPLSHVTFRLLKHCGKIWGVQCQWDVVKRSFLLWVIDTPIFTATYCLCVWAWKVHSYILCELNDPLGYGLFFHSRCFKPSATFRGRYAYRSYIIYEELL